MISYFVHQFLRNKLHSAMIGNYRVTFQLTETTIQEGVVVNIGETGLFCGRQWINRVIAVWSMPPLLPFDRRELRIPVKEVGSVCMWHRLLFFNTLFSCEYLNIPLVVSFTFTS